MREPVLDYPCSYAFCSSPFWTAVFIIIQLSLTHYVCWLHKGQTICVFSSKVFGLRATTPEELFLGASSEARLRAVSKIVDFMPDAITV